MKKKILLILLFLAIGNVYADCATLDCLADNLIPQVKSILSIIDWSSYIFGIVFTMKGIFKLKEHNDSKGQVKLSIAIIMLIAGACFMALPSLMNMGIETMSLDQAGATKLGNF